MSISCPNCHSVWQITATKSAEEAYTQGDRVRCIQSGTDVYSSCFDRVGDVQQTGVFTSCRVGDKGPVVQQTGDVIQVKWDHDDHTWIQARSQIEKIRMY